MQRGRHRRSACRYLRLARSRRLRSSPEHIEIENWERRSIARPRLPGRPGRSSPVRGTPFKDRSWNPPEPASGKETCAAAAGDAGDSASVEPPRRAQQRARRLPHGSGNPIAKLALKAARTHATGGWWIGRGRRKQNGDSPTPASVSVSPFKLTMTGRGGLVQLRDRDRGSKT